MAAPAPSQWYRLTNTFTGPTVSLDVVNDGGQASSGQLQMATSGNHSGQYWQLTPYPSSSSSTYALFTQFLGISKRLDVYGDDKTKPHLGNAGNYSGQIWTISSWNDGTWQLTNQYSGSGLHLDVYSDTKVPFMGSGDHTGQHWIFTSLGREGSQGNQGSQGSQPSHTDKKVPIAAIIGGAVGGALLLSVVVGFLWWCVIRARRRHRIESMLAKEPLHAPKFPTPVPGPQGNNWPAHPSSPPTMTSQPPSFPVAYVTPTHSTVTSSTPFNPLPSPHGGQYLVQNPADFDSNASIMSSGARTAPPISTSRPISPLSNQRLSDEQADFVAGLYRQRMPPDDVARVVERMVGDEGSSLTAHGADRRDVATTVSDNHPALQAPPAYDFKAA